MTAYGYQSSSYRTEEVGVLNVVTGNRLQGTVTFTVYGTHGDHTTTLSAVDALALAERVVDTARATLQASSVEGG